MATSGVRRLAILYTAAVVSVSVLASARYSREIATLMDRLPGRDVTGHFVLTGVLAFLVALGFELARFRGRRLGIPGALAVVAVGVTLDEVAQIWLPVRAFSWVDLGGSYAGIVAFGALAFLVHGLRRRRAAA